jgi:hypothetical protein
VLAVDVSLSFLGMTGCRLLVDTGAGFVVSLSTANLPEQNRRTDCASRNALRSGLQVLNREQLGCRARAARPLRFGPRVAHEHFDHCSALRMPARRHRAGHAPRARSDDLLGVRVTADDVEASKPERTGSRRPCASSGTRATAST